MATEPSSKKTRKKPAKTTQPDIFKKKHRYGTLVRVILLNGTSKLAYCSGVQKGDMACSVSLELPDKMRLTGVDSDNVWDHVTYEGTEKVDKEEASKHFGSKAVNMPKENWPNRLPKVRHIFRVVSPTT